MGVVPFIDIVKLNRERNRQNLVNDVLLDVIQYPIEVHFNG